MKRRVRLGPVGEFVRRRILATRTGLGLTQEDLGKKAGLPGNTISQIELGARRIDVDDVAVIARALDVDVPYLLGAAPEHQRDVIAEAEARGAREALDQVRGDLRADAFVRSYESGTYTASEVFGIAARYTPDWVAQVRAERAGGDRG